MRVARAVRQEVRLPGQVRAISIGVELTVAGLATLIELGVKRKALKPTIVT